MNRRIGVPIHIISPGAIDQLTGGFGFLRRIRDGLTKRGEEVQVHELPGPHPFVDEPSRRTADHVFSMIPDGAAVLVDGLALPVAAHALWVDRYRLRMTALVHHPLHLEAGLDAEEAALLRRLERDTLAYVRRVIVPSRSTAADVMALDVPEKRITVANPGTDRAIAATGSGGAGPVLLCVASLSPRKGHLVLIEALSRLMHLPWRLVLVGAERHPGHERVLRDAMAERGIAARVDLLGELAGDALERYWQGTDIFVLPTFHEGYGMVAAEALARGLPLVVSDAGALAEFVPPAAGGLVPAGDAAALARALEPLISDADVRAQAALAARTAGAALPTWDDAIGIIRSALAATLASNPEIEHIA